MGRIHFQRAAVVVALSAAGLAGTIRHATPASAVPNYDNVFTLSDGPVSGSFFGIPGLHISPDGLWAVYYKNNQLHTVPTGGGRERLIDAAARLSIYASLTISPDSSRVVYQDETGLASQAIAGSPEVRLLNGSEFNGTQIAGSYVLTLDSLRGEVRNLYTVPIDGGTPVRLNPGAIGTSSVDSFEVSPDGQRVVFSGSLGGEPSALYSVPVAGGTAVKISPVLSGGKVDRIVGFSPTGYALFMASRSGDPRHDMYSVGVDGVVRQFDPTLDDYSKSDYPTFDGAFVYGIAHSAAGDTLYRANADGTGVTVLFRPTPATAVLGYPEVVAGSNRVVVTKRVGSTTDLMSVRSDGSDVVTVFANFNTSHDFAVSPDGRTVVASSGTGPLAKRPIDGSAVAVNITTFVAKVVRFTASGVVVNRGDAPWMAFTDGRLAAEVAPALGFIDSRTFVVTPDGRRIIVFQDRQTDGEYGLYSYGPSYADGKHSTFVPLAPTRILDTRPSEQIGYAGGKPGAGAVVRLQVRGRAGIPNNGDVKAVVLNVTASNASAEGYVTVWPLGTKQPQASNLNLEATGQTRPNLVTVQVGADGAVSIFTSGGTDLIADVAGYYSFAGNATSGRMFPLPPTRVLDTRSGPRPAAGATVQLPVRGRGGVPGAGVSAVVLNVTATAAAGPGFVTVWPSGTPRPLASNLNVEEVGQSIPNQVIVPLGSDGSVSLFTDSGTHLIADLAGWYSNSDEKTGNSGLFLPVAPNRVLDTRPNSLVNWTGAKPSAGAVVPLSFGTPGDGVSAYALNVTMADATAPGFVTAYPTGPVRPNASNLNGSSAGQTIPNHVTMAVDRATASVSLYTNAGSHLIGDVNGVYRS
jgi:catechol 2,3-dioxygenase-like lactoylglutathione lyase family enzyme